MFTLSDFRVKFKNPEEVKGFIKKHGEFAIVCYNTDVKYAEKVGESCLQSGHLSGSRHLYMVFELKNVPRSAVDQIVRATQGFVTNVQSLRYCNKDGKVSIYIAPELLDSPYMVKTIKDQEDIVNAQYNYIQTFLEDGGITGEKANEIARTILPIGVATECNIAVNLECLMHLANVRLCTRAELPIRTIVKEMVKQVTEVEPRYKPYLVPNCVKNRRCPEGKHSCGKYNIFTNTVNE
ncbi:FAD-dependent thymidylate synthase [Intestinibacter bartlettii]|uniref:FAD-dependent thymidylate synthase n=1 Tax=Intestinibacter bartlettii TaxID=261299 RepID=UPI0026761764|nr:FAD-dependent thymidylate synthase [Intestinibacter bartlettii]